MSLITDYTDNPAVLLLGDPRLRRLSRTAVPDSDESKTAAVKLQCALAAFRAAHGFGRAIAAPQLGIDLRCLACALDTGPLASDQPFIMLNPLITWRSDEKMTLWDDCMSFPNLLVKVRRHRSISVTYATELGQEITHEGLDFATAELLQHEIDHLDGTLAVDHALDRESLVTRTVFEANRAHFEAQVDSPTSPRTALTAGSQPPNPTISPG